MSTTPKHMPVGVSPQAAKLLERAYALNGDEQSRALYRDWAETYDETMLQGLNYLSPARVADPCWTLAAAPGWPGRGWLTTVFRHWTGSMCPTK